MAKDKFYGLTLLGLAIIFTPLPAEYLAFSAFVSGYIMGYSARALGQTP